MNIIWIIELIFGSLVMALAFMVSSSMVISLRQIHIREKDKNNKE